MQPPITGERLAALIQSAIASAPRVADYLNRLNPRRHQTGCVIRLTYSPAGISPLQDLLVLPVGESMTWEEVTSYTQYTDEKIRRMFGNNGISSWSSRDPALGSYGGAIRSSIPDIGIAVSGWWEEYDVLHAVWLGLTNQLIKDDQATTLLRELDHPVFGDGVATYQHLAPRLCTQTPPPGWVIRYFNECGGALPNVWRG